MPVPVAPPEPVAVPTAAVLKILVGLSHIFIFSFIGLILASGIGYAGWMRWQEAQMGSAPPSGPPAGGFSA